MILLVINQLAANPAASDNQLMEDVVNRKADALESIYRRYGSLLRTVILGVIRDELTLTRLFTIDDEFFFDVLGDRINPATGLLDDPTPPFKLYLSNENQLEDGVNPFAPKAF